MARWMSFGRQTEEEEGLAIDESSLSISTDVSSQPTKDSIASSQLKIETDTKSKVLTYRNTVKQECP